MVQLFHDRWSKSFLFVDIVLGFFGLQCDKVKRERRM